MYRNYILIFIICLHGVIGAQSIDTTLMWDLEEVSVVSNKLYVASSELPDRVTVLGERQLKRSSANRLSEILGQVNGLFIDAEFGDGVQMQGLDSDYTMILIDGVPLIGRKGGVLDLERISLLDIERVEILKGPYSTLYGSEALAGVINIITKGNNSKDRLTLQGGLRSNDVYDLGASMDKSFSGLNLSASGGLRSSSGFSVLPDQNGYTLPPYMQYFANISGVINPKKINQWRADYRFFKETQEESYNFSGQPVQGNTMIQDHTIQLQHQNIYGEAFNVTHTVFFEQYRQEQSLFDANNGEVVDIDNFDHIQFRAASEGDWYIDDDLKATIGGGFLFNQIETNRYVNKPREYNAYGYGQVKYTWNNNDLVGGTRYEWNNQASGAVTANLSYNRRIEDEWIIGVSVGTGYKLPDYRQKYLSYTNATVGYTIIGTESTDLFKELLTSGLIQEEFVDLSLVDPLKSEYSFAYSGNVVYKGIEGLQLKLNLFRNDLFDLIDTYTAALKTNGLFVYSYRNLDEIYTQGIEFSGNWQVGRWELSSGYQYLDAQDKTVRKQVKDGLLYGRDPGTLRSYKLELSDYKGLFNRSRHSAQTKLAFALPDISGSAFFQAFYRGQFGRFDIDGNNVLNLDEEFVDGYVTINIGASAEWQGINFTIGVDNILDFQNLAEVPTEQGRILWTRISHTINSK